MRRAGGWKTGVRASKDRLFLWKVSSSRSGSAGLVVLVWIGVVACHRADRGGWGRNLVPRDDQSEFEIAISTPKGYTLAAPDRAFTEIESRGQAARYPASIYRDRGNNNWRRQGARRRHSLIDLLPHRRR